MDGSARIPSLDELLDHERWLQALARKLVRDAATADDLVQETWFRTLSAERDPRGGSRTPVSDARSWLGRVLRNVWRERGRAERARAGREARAAAAETTPSARESLERFELQQRLAALVLELDEPFRSVVIWRYYEGRSAAAIATELGEPAERVRWRLMRARELLRRRLDRDRNDWADRYALFLPLAQRGAPAAPSAAAGTAGVGLLAIGFKPYLWAGAGVLLVWSVARLVASEPPGPTVGPFAPGSSLLASEETASSDRLAGTAPEAVQRAPLTSSAPRSEISGPARLRGEVRGIVKAAEDGSALEGAELALFAPRGRALLHEVRSGAGGSFLFAGLEAGEYELGCRMQGRRPVRLPQFGLVAGGDAVLEVVLELGFPVSVEVAERAGGAPVEGARVELVAGGRDTVGWYSSEGRSFHGLSGVTSPQGRVELLGAARGTYQYSVQSGGHATALGEALVEPGTDPLRILLELGGVVHGVVRHASGERAENARVFLNSVAYVNAPDGLFYRQNGVASDRDGAYRIEGVPEGVYHAVALLADGSGSFHFDPDARGERDLGRIVVESSAEVRLDFDLPAPGRVRGLVLDTAGAPVPDASVSVSWADFKAPRAGFFPIASAPDVKESIHHERKTDAKGRFVIDALRVSHRPLELRVRCAGFVEEKLDLDAAPGASHEPVITLRRLGATITGRLSDASGKPVAGVTVGAWEMEGERCGDFFLATSGADGVYALQLPAESKGDGRHRVQPSLFDSSPLRCEPERREGVLGGARDVDFVLWAKHRLTGTVVDDSGSAVLDFVVHRLERESGTADGWEACRDANRGEGRFDLHVDTARAIELRFSAPGCDPAVLADLQEPGERRIVLRRAADLVGVLLDAERRAVAGAVVALATLDSAIYATGTGFAPRDTTDAQGRFRLRAVPEPLAATTADSVRRVGNLVVCPRRNDAPPLVHYALPERRGGTLELVLPRCSPVELEFVDASGKPLDGSVLVFDSEGWPMEPAFETHLSDQQDPGRGLLSAGRARFCLRPGTYQAVVVRGAEAKEVLSFEVDDGRGGTVQKRSFTVGGGR